MMILGVLALAGVAMWLWHIYVVTPIMARWEKRWQDHQDAYFARARSRLDMELARLAADDGRAFTARILWDILVATGADTDGDTGPEALIAGMGWEGFQDMVLRDVQELRAAYDEALEEMP